MKELTRAEENVMQIYWELNKAFVKDVIEQFPDPKPSYSTISTVTRILESKGFLSYKKYGNTYQYFPVISKTEYAKQSLKKLSSNYFNNSLKKLVSNFPGQSDLDIREVDEIIEMLNQLKSKKK